MKESQPASQTGDDAKGLERRRFLQLMGASVAFGGLVGSGCLRKPAAEILPYAHRPEELLPGDPRYFATSAFIGGSVQGLLIESQDGRPSKVEGNPRHPSGRGRANAWAQASILDLYDPNRSTMVAKGGQKAARNWHKHLRQACFAWLDERIEAAQSTQGRGLGILVQADPSPTRAWLMQQISQRFPAVSFYLDDEAADTNARAGASLVGLEGHRPVPAYQQARVVASFDADFLGTEGNTTRAARLFAQGRRLEAEADTMSRLYAFEPSFSLTGANADHRETTSYGGVGRALLSLCNTLLQRGMGPPPESDDVVASIRRATGGTSPSKTLTALASDLWQARGAGIVVAGHRQPPWVHALTHWLNAALDNKATIAWIAQIPSPSRTLRDLAEDLQAQRLDTLLILGGNPVYSAPGDVHLKAALGQLTHTLHLSSHLDATSKRCLWHVPMAHYLEAWGDWTDDAGHVSLQQPLIAPLYAGISPLDILAKIAGRPETDTHAIVQAYWRICHGGGQDFTTAWRRWLHDGVVDERYQTPIVPRPSFVWGDLANRVAPTATSGWDVLFQRDFSTYDGRFANNAWLQELPDPITKLTWDNAALVSPRSARELGVGDGDLLRIRVDGNAITIPVLISQGVAASTVVLSLGYGRHDAGVVGDGVGVDVQALRSAKSPYHTTAATVASTPGTHALAITQDYSSQTEPFTGHTRGIVAEASLATYRRNPRFAAALSALPAADIVSIDQNPHPFLAGAKSDLQQWGMSIDLNACTGCSACVTACQAENNIPVVGRERVLQGRELHWLRIDRYVAGDETSPRIVQQPIVCQQCENAPCETVCPVGATAHSPEGLNDMAYNRCIGTRYCSNNCPYKVRRFNYFNFAKENDATLPLLAMQRNQDVTVRFRGVMEKCTYCVQRINRAKIAAHRRGDGRVTDGAIIPACAQTCPTEAIVFGDITDPRSGVSLAKKNPRNYALLAELNTRPRTSYQAKLRNLNEDLAQDV